MFKRLMAYLQRPAIKREQARYLALLRDPDMEVREQAAQLLRKRYRFEDKEAIVQALSEALQDESFKVRNLAAHTLKRFAEEGYWGDLAAQVGALDVRDLRQARKEAVRRYAEGWRPTTPLETLCWRIVSAFRTGLSFAPAFFFAPDGEHILQVKESAVWVWDARALFGPVDRRGAGWQHAAYLSPWQRYQSRQSLYLP